MSTKLLLILLSGLLICPVFAQKMRYRPRRQTTTQQQQTTTSPSAQKKDEKKTTEQKTAPAAPARTSSSTATAGSGRFDPKKPGLTQRYVDYIMDDVIRKELLERKFPAKLPTYKKVDEEDEEEEKEKDKNKKPEKFRILSQIDYTIMLNRFRSLTTHFELTEVTNIRPVWFERYLAELGKFDPIVYQLNQAVQERSNERYIRAVQLFKNQQDVCLRMLKEKKPGLTTEERAALQKKNMQIRIDNRRKQRQAELQRRQAELKRRQEEQLKQQKQQQKPAASAAGK